MQAQLVILGHLRALGDRIVVVEKKSDRYSRSGIIIIVQDENYTYQRQGEVMSAGPKADPVKAGDKILFGSHQGFKHGKTTDGDTIWNIEVKRVFGLIEDWVVLNG